MSRLIYIKEQMWELVELRVVRNIEWTNNSNIRHFWSQILVFQIGKNSINFSIF